MSDEGNSIMDSPTHDLIHLQTERKKLCEKYTKIYFKIRKLDEKIDGVLSEMVECGRRNPRR